MNPVRPRPKVGNTLNIAPNTRMNIMATQNWGAAIPRTAKILPILSKIEVALYGG